MKKVMLDSCVFFKMIKFNLAYEQFGEEGFRSYLNYKIDEHKKLEKELSAKMGDNFMTHKRFKNLPFDEKLVKYKEWANNEQAKLQRAIDNAQENIKTNKQLPQERAQKLKEKIAINQKTLDSIYPFELISDARADYLLEEDVISSGLIFKEFLDNNVEFYIADYSFEEIMSHTNLDMLKNNTEKPEWLKIDESVLRILIDEYEDRLANPHHLFYEENEIRSLLKNVNIVTTNSNEIRAKIEDLAALYRLKEDDVPMRDDVNSVDKYGDSCIMAVASMTGMPLLTHNGKDFVFESEGDTKRREHIKKKNSQVDYATDVCAFSPAEFLFGEGYEELKQESKFSLIEEESLAVDKEYYME